MRRFCDSLKRRGYDAFLRGGGVRINPPPPPELGRKIQRHYYDIQRELTTDPRPELVDDSAAWNHLIADAEPELAGALHGFRCCGARLERTPRFGYQIRRGNDGWWPTPAAFVTDYKKWLLPDGSFPGRLDAPINRALRALEKTARDCGWGK